jgi:hypothetical protein
LNPLTLDAWLNLFNKMQELGFFREMPPKERMRQPSEAERVKILAWLGSELR